MQTRRKGSVTLVIEFNHGSVSPLKLNFSTIATSRQVQEVLLSSFECAAMPDGTWRSRNTFENNYRSLKTFFSSVPKDDNGYPIPAMTKQYIEDSPVSVGHIILSMLRFVFRDDQQAPAPLLSILKAQRSAPKTRRRKPEISAKQFQLLQKESVATLRSAVNRIERGWNQIENPPDWPPENLVEKKLDQYLREIVETGDLAVRHKDSSGAFLTLKLRKFLVEMGPTDKAPGNLFARLYPTADDVAAATFALTSICGWNLSIVPQLLVEDIKITSSLHSATIYSVTLRKPRRGSRDEWIETYIDDGPLSKGRVISLILRMMQGVRNSFAQTNDPRRELVAYIPRVMNKPNVHNPNTPLLTLNEIDKRAVAAHLSKWLSTYGDLKGTRPSDYRKYFVTNVHPQGHTMPENLAYANAAGLSTDVVRKLTVGLGAALGIQDPTVLNKSVITAEDLWQNQATYEQVQSINNSETDSGPSACLNPDSNPATELPCDSGFLTCFACKNATILPRHLPSCIALRDHLEISSERLPPGAWTPTHTRALSALKDLLTEDKFFDSRQLELSASKVTSTEKEIAKAICENRWLP